MTDGTLMGAPDRPVLDPDFWTGRKVLVTGAAGFAGSHLVQALAEQGADVRAMQRPGGTKVVPGPHITPFEADMTNPEDCVRAVEGMDTVFNIGGLFRRLLGGRPALEAIHVDATETLMRAAKASGVRRFIHVSTIGVHGDVKQGPGGEDTPFGPGDDYQETKLDGETLARRLGVELDLDTVIIRPCSISGAGDDRLLKLVLPIASRKFVMIGPGTTRFHMVHIKDLCQGFLRAAEVDAAVGETFIIGGNSTPTLNELADDIAAIIGVKPPRLHIPIGPIMLAGRIVEAICLPLGVEPPLHPRRVAFFTKNRHFDISKAQRLLGYEPTCGHKETFSEIVDWCRQTGRLPPLTAPAHKKGADISSA